MDDLDRLYLELVEILRREQPRALGQPLRLLDVHERFIPYRRVRNRVGLYSNDDYEIALTRLLSGERGYLDADRDVQQELSSGLAEILPDARRYLAFPETRVMLNVEKIPPPGDTRYAPPELQHAENWPEEHGAGRELAEADDGDAETPEADAVLEEEAIESQSDLSDKCPRCAADVPVSGCG